MRLNLWHLLRMSLKSLHAHFEEIILDENVLRALQLVSACFVLKCPQLHFDEVELIVTMWHIDGWSI